MSLSLFRTEDQKLILAKIEKADTFWKRFKGLQFRRHLDRHTGIWLAPCSSLHTCFMRFSIDVIMLDRNYVVVGIRRGITPWRMVLCAPGTTQIIECNVGATDIATGDRLQIISP